MLYATCPFCSSTLQISDAQLKAKDGLVRCGHCKDIFDARSHLINVTKAHKKISPTLPADRETDKPPIAIWEHNLSNSIEKKPKPYGIISIGLLALLTLQFVLFDHQQLLKNPNLTPYIDQLSDRFELAIPYYKNLDELQVVSRTLSPHESAENILHLELSIKNVSQLQQQYPSIIFTLLSKTGEKVAQRTFKKHEYLADHPKISSFKAQSVVSIELDFQRPKKAAAGFEIGFSNELTKQCPWFLMPPC